MRTFWQFVDERMAVHERRAAGAPAPWTDDPVLRGNFFTNCFRELDPGTEVAVGIMSRRSPAWVRAWNLLLYRRLNREDTWRAIGGFEARPGGRDLLKALRAVRGPVFTGAHQVNMLQQYPRLGGDPLARQAAMMRDHDMVRKWAAAMAACGTAKEAFHATVDARLPGVGGFLAWQLTLDWRYGDPSQYSDDVWAPVQAGALAGLTLVYPGSWANKADTEDALVMLRRHSANTRGLTVAAVEHSLCEYSKYVRIAGGGHAKGKFNGS